MTEKNHDKLLKDFFAANRQEIADNGFTLRVMSHLPRRRFFVEDAVNILCIILLAALFVAKDGVWMVWGIVCDIIDKLYEQIAAAQIDTRSLIIVGVVLLFLVYRKIVSLA